MPRHHLAGLAALCIASPALAQVKPFPTDFKVRDITTNGTTIHVRVGGHGPAVTLLHGFGDTGDVWAPLAAVLEANHTVVVPDLRGMGLSSHPADGYDKKTEAADIAGVLDSLKIDQTSIVAHDIGNMVAFAFTARYPQRVSRLVLIDAPVPGIANWDELKCDPRLWHFNFYGPDARPGGMHSALNQFHAFPQDAKDNQASLAQGKLSTPVMAIGGSGSFGTVMATVASAAFTTVDGRVIADAGHWIMEEQPAAVIAVVRPFLDQ